MNFARSSLDYFSQQACIGLCAIANPQRFFNLLSSLRISFQPKVFPDHYFFNSNNLKFPENIPILMTEKDAFKCRAFAQENLWYLKISVELPPRVLKAVLELITV